MKNITRHSKSSARTTSRLAASKRGGILVEFALIAFIVYLLIAVTLSFGRMLWAAQVMQQATDLFAREMSRTPLDANDTFEDAIEDPDVFQRLYREDFLVIDVDDWAAGGTGLTLLEWLDATYIDTYDYDGDSVNDPLPTVNRMLVPLMFIEELPDLRGGGGIRTYLRYPGTLLNTASRPAGPTMTGYTVVVPLIIDRDADTGEETDIEWVEVAEEIESGTDANPFQISSPTGGVVALRMNYPFQSSTLSLITGGVGHVDADDTVDAGKAPPAELGELITDDTGFGTYGGTYGLGRQGVLNNTVRPYRKALATQAIYRREVFR